MTTPLSTAVTDPHTLAGEHARLLRDVTRRTTPVLALLDARAWPYAELGTLTTFLRSAVLRQVSDEEAHLYPHDPSAPPFAELSADHVRLHTLTAQLEQARATSCPRVRLRGLVAELLTTLRKHLDEEQAALAALSGAASEVPGVAELAAGHDDWPRREDTPIRIEVGTLPDEQAAELCIERLLRLRPGQTAELHSDDEGVMGTVCRWLRQFDAGRFGFTSTPAGLCVTRRPVETPAGIGYPG